MVHIHLKKWFVKQMNIITFDRTRVMISTVGVTKSFREKLVKTPYYMIN